MYIILDERECYRIGIDNIGLYEQNKKFGVSLWGFYDRIFDSDTKRYYNRWGYKVINKSILMLSVINYGIKHDVIYS